MRLMGLVLTEQRVNKLVHKVLVGIKICACTSAPNTNIVAYHVIYQDTHHNHACYRFMLGCFQ